jgi:hypothetical protein
MINIVFLDFLDRRFRHIGKSTLHVCLSQNLSARILNSGNNIRISVKLGFDRLLDHQLLLDQTLKNLGSCLLRLFGRRSA